MKEKLFMHADKNSDKLSKEGKGLQSSTLQANSAGQVGQIIATEDSVDAEKDKEEDVIMLEEEKA